jgi:Tol biopolymer transport system component
VVCLLALVAACGGGAGTEQVDRERRDGPAVSRTETAGADGEVSGSGLDAAKLDFEGCDGVAPLPPPSDGVPEAAIAFYDGPFQEFELFLMAPDGSDRQPLVEGINLTSPMLSPDGTLIAYDGFGPESRDVMVVDRELAHEPSPVTSWALCGLPAGQLDELEVMSDDLSDGFGDQLTDQLQTVEQGGVLESDGKASWSPDGTRLAFESWRLGSPGLFVMDLRDGSATLLIVEGDDEEVSYLRPSWSPDGSHITFVRRVTGRGNGFDIMVMNADGSDPRPLTDNGEIDEDQPRWSPDGSQVVFWSDRDGDQELFVQSVNDDGDAVGDPTQLTDNAVNDNWPVWSPDGTELLFGTQRDGEEEWVWHMQILDLESGEITDLGQQGRPRSWVDPAAG